jgi:STAT protein, DNA binding domain/STAT protein, all-alpha domain
LINEIRNIANMMNENDSADGASKWYHFQKAADDLPQFNTNDLLLRLNSIMQYEMSLFTSVQSATSLLDTDFDRQIAELTANANAIESEKQELIKNYENFQVLLYELTFDDSNFATEMDKEVAKLANQLRIECDSTHIVEKREKLFRMMETFACVVEQYTSQVISTHIESWKLNQKKYVSNTHVDLVRIQRWCEAIASAICKVKDQTVQIHEVQRDVKFESYIPPSEHFEFLGRRLFESFIKLAEGSFVIEEQPSQVIKINNKIRASLRLLIGANFNDRSSIPSAQAFIVSDVKAKEVLSTQNFTGRPSGELVNFTANMAATKSNEYRANFSNMQLKKIDRALKRDVTDEKFAICFKVSFKFGNRELSIVRMSLAVVVIVHVNQVFYITK